MVLGGVDAVRGSRDHVGVVPWILSASMEVNQQFSSALIHGTFWISVVLEGMNIECVSTDPISIDPLSLVDHVAMYSQISSVWFY